MCTTGRTMGALSVIVRWFIFLTVSVGWQAQSQAIQQTAEVDSSYNFYYEQPCCSGNNNKTKYHGRHRRDHVREFTCGNLYYRTFFMDSKRDALYVGAMDRLYRLNMNNISSSSCDRDAINLEPSNVAQCVSKGKSEHFDCRNHVRVIQPMGDGSRLYVCGTNAHSPKDWVLYITDSDYICHACWELANYQCNNPDNQQRLLGHIQVCIGCGRSILRSNSRLIIKPNATEEERNIASILSEWIQPRQITDTDQACAPCWYRARRALQQRIAQGENQPDSEQDQDELQSNPELSQEEGNRVVHDPNPDLNTERCINCDMMIFDGNAHNLSHESDGLVNVIKMWIYPRDINNMDSICHACWELADHQANSRITCIVCGQEVSLDSCVQIIRPHISEEEQRIADKIREWVQPHQSNLTHLPRHEYVPGIGMGVAKCPYDPADNSTALWVERGNPGSLPALYSGTNAEFTKADTVIFRTDLHNLTTGRREFSFKRTLKYDSKWLDKPNFVGSFDVGEYVLFFFRETAVEYINCGKAVYSRVARVCKRDTGGKNILSQNWATYLKARLNCSIPGEFPFYFNEIQSIYKVPGDDSRFYGVFTTASTGLMGSAICTFTIGDIQRAFEGKFKEQATSSSAWLPVISSRVPEPRPGTCVNDTSSLPDTVLNFIRSHPLMDSAVSHEHEKPIYYKRDLFFTRLVVDRVKVDMMGHQLDYTVYYAGTNEGKIHKIVQWTRNGDSQSALLDIFDVTPGEPIQAMAISRSHGSLYAASDKRVLQLRLALCARRYDACVRCARDPYCGWDRDAGVCREYMPGLIQDVANETADICDSSISRKSVSATWGQSLHLGSFVKMPEVLHPRAVSWFHYSREKGRHPITFNKPDKYIETSEHGLLIISVNEGDAGRYDCWLGGSLLCSYNITVDTHRCSPPEKSNEYQKIYSNWCHEFEKYKTAMKTWERKQEQCARQNDSNQNTHPNEIV